MSCSVTITRPPVSAPSALMVVSPPKNQRCSPSPGWWAMGARVSCDALIVVPPLSIDAMHGACASRLAAAIPARVGVFRALCETLARMAWSPERLIDEVDVLSARGLPRMEFFAELAPRLRKVVDNDATCWHTLDPHTRLL